MRAAGYTLLEMLLVTAMLATLAALVVPGMIGRGDQALRARALADMQAVAERLNLYRLDAGRFPTTEQGIAALVERPTGPPTPLAWNPGGYLDRTPTDPWGVPYDYVATSDHAYRLRSLGADGAAGGTGAAADVELERP
jgi:general secretion pathway protein G